MILIKMKKENKYKIELFKNSNELYFTKLKQFIINRKNKIENNSQKL